MVQLGTYSSSTLGSMRLNNPLDSVATARFITFPPMACSIIHGWTQQC